MTKLKFILVVILSLGLTGCARENYNDEIPEIESGLHEVVFSPSAGYSPAPSELDEAMAVMEARLAAQNIRGYELRIDYEANEIIVRFPERFEPDETITMLGETALLTFREGLPHDWQTHEDIPLILTGADVKRATALFEDGNHTVLLEFKESGIEAFSEATGRLAGTLIPISIWLDDYCFAFPTVSTKITGGSAIISGSFTADEAVSLAQKINSGALPFKLEGVVKN